MLDSVRILKNVININSYDISKVEVIKEGSFPKSFYIQLYQLDRHDRYVPDVGSTAQIKFLRIYSTAQTPIDQTVIKTLTQPYSTIDPSIWYVELTESDVNLITSGGFQVILTEGAKITTIYSKMAIRKEINAN